MNYDLMRRLQEEPSEEHLWDMILSYQNIMFKTYSGLPFTYEVRKGRNGEYTKELWIDRREKSKSLAWSSVRLAFHNIKQTGEIVERPKALGDIRGVTYIYGMFYRFGLIDVPDKVKEKMKDKEMYDLKHELISAQIKLENAEKELAKMKEENNDLQMQIVKLETEMKNRRR